MSTEQELKALPYREQLKALMREAQRRHDIWAMLEIQERIDKEKES